MATSATATRQMALPFAIDASGRIAVTTDPNQQLQDRVTQVVTTPTNTRLMHPDFGVDLDGLLFSAMDDETTTLIGVQIQSALAIWEPGARLVSVTPSSDPASGRVGIAVLYATQSSATVGDNVQSAFISIGA